MIDLGMNSWMSGLFGDAEVEKLFSLEADLQRFLRVEAAWTRALGKVLKTPSSEKTAQMIEMFEPSPGALRAGFAKDGVPIPALVRLLKDHVGERLAVSVHEGLTSQDVMDTSLMLALMDVLAIIGARLDALDNQLVELQGEFGASKIMAYTRMQPAIETTASGVIDRWLQPISRLQTDIANAIEDCSQIQWGGPIGARDHSNAAQIGTAFAENLRLRDPGMAWHTDRTCVIQASNVMARVTLVTGKIGEDIALMSALGSEHVALSGGGSSAMAHKNNPVKAETLICLSDYASTLQAGITRAARHEAFRSGRAWMLEWITLSQMCNATGAGLVQAKELLESVMSFGRT